MSKRHFTDKTTIGNGHIPLLRRRDMLVEGIQYMHRPPIYIIGVVSACAQLSFTKEGTTGLYCVNDDLQLDL